MNQSELGMNFSFGLQPSSKHLLLLHLQTLHIYTERQTHSQYSVILEYNNSTTALTNHNWCLWMLLASLQPGTWCLVSTLNRNDKSWKKALKTRLVAARPIDRFQRTRSAQQFMQFELQHVTAPLLLLMILKVKATPSMRSLRDDAVSLRVNQQQTCHVVFKPVKLRKSWNQRSSSQSLSDLSDRWCLR